MHIKSRMTQDYMSQMLYTGAKDFDTFLNGSHKAFSGKKKNRTGPPNLEVCIGP